jgi:hypothetical protein
MPNGGKIKRQRICEAAKLAESCLQLAIQRIDENFVEGFAQDNPELVGCFMQTIALFVAGDDIATEINNSHL